jgi:hypothetical protein
MVASWDHSSGAFRPVGIVQQMPRNPPNHRNRPAAPAHPDHEPVPSGGGTPRASRARATSGPKASMLSAKL